MGVPSSPRTVVLTGAGLSTASGIPDYRSADGMWKHFDPDEFHVTRFLADPDRFWARRVELTRAMRILEAVPNDGHRLLADAVRSGRVDWIITQNIDGLHRKAGTPTERLLEVHGNAALCRCVGCDATFPTHEVVAGYAGRAPRCACGDVLKPDVVLFGEPVTTLDQALDIVRGSDRIVTVGTSLQVWPVAGLVTLAIEHGKDLVIVNREPTPFDKHADQIVKGEAIDGLRQVIGPADAPRHP
jgi:NAD-dependent deacetylase